MQVVSLHTVRGATHGQLQAASSLQLPYHWRQVSLLSLWIRNIARRASFHIIGDKYPYSHYG
jgi:hypothetical protein